MPKLVPVQAGAQFGRWTVTADRIGAGDLLVRCACGNEGALSFRTLNNGGSRSCGCLKRELTSANKRVHGTGYEDYRYRLWHMIKRKCLNAKSPDYHYYGGRGITMHGPWISDYSGFAAWLDANLGERPDGFTLDRIDNDGNYEPGNLRWASRATQAQNRRNRWRNRTLIGAA